MGSAYVSFTAKGLRVNELRREGWTFAQALKIAEEEFSNFDSLPPALLQPENYEPRVEETCGGLAVQA